MHSLSYTFDTISTLISTTAPFVFSSSPNQNMDNIQAWLGPSSIDSSLYTTAVPTATIASVNEGQSNYSGVPRTSYHAELQQSPPYHDLNCPSLAMLELQDALYNTSIDTQHHMSQPHEEQQQYIHYTHQYHQAVENTSLFFIGHFHPLHQPARIENQFMGIDGSNSSWGQSSSSFSSPSLSSIDGDEDPDEKGENKRTENEISPPTPADVHVENAIIPVTPARRHRRSSNPKSLSILKSNRHPKLIKSSNTPLSSSRPAANPTGKPHSCDICGRKFTRACNLQSHLTTHLGEKPHSCPECALAFARIYDMRRHYRIHSNETPYKCTLCPEAFKRIEARERHYQSHHGYNKK